MVRSDKSNDLFSAPRWHRALRRYVMFLGGMNLVWEFAHLPLYTLWNTASSEEIVFAAVHCTGGDILIGTSALLLALFVVGNDKWPIERSKRVFWLTLVLGFSYTVFSEWLNIEVRQAWAYNDAMPVIPVLNMGLSPALQWVLIPSISYYCMLIRLRA